MGVLMERLLNLLERIAIALERIAASMADKPYVYTWPPEDDERMVGGND